MKHKLPELDKKHTNARAKKSMKPALAVVINIHHGSPEHEPMDSPAEDLMDKKMGIKDDKKEKAMPAFSEVMKSLMMKKAKGKK